MGCDGGTIPRRDELVKVKKKKEAKDRDSERAFQWKHCSITQQTLEPPIVMCGLGRLYNKVSVIEGIISKDLPEGAQHIKSLKDIKDLCLTQNPARAESSNKEDIHGASYICPVIGLEMSGKFRFVALWSCGCVFSERALKQIKTSICHKCQKPFAENDVIVLNGTEEDVAVMKENMAVRHQMLKKTKEKKIKVKIERGENGVEIGDVQAQEIKSENPEMKTTKMKGEMEQVNNTERSNECKVKAEASKKQVTKTEKSHENTIKLEKHSHSSVVTKQPQKRSGVLKHGAEDHKLKKIKKDYSVAKDPDASDVYKSLFTTHKSEREQDRAHWVTYNPFYN